MLVRQLTLNPNCSSAPKCTEEHDPTESVEYAQGKRTKLHGHARIPKPIDTRSDTGWRDIGLPGQLNAGQQGLGHSTSKSCPILDCHHLVMNNCRAQVTLNCI